jgi:hypothetical protein
MMKETLNDSKSQNFSHSRANGNPGISVFCKNHGYPLCSNAKALAARGRGHEVFLKASKKVELIFI